MNGRHALGMLSFISPVLLITSFLLLSMIEQNLKGILLTIGAIITLIIGRIMFNVNVDSTPKNRLLCNMFSLFNPNQGVPLSSITLWFILGYIGTTLNIYKLTNWWLILLLSFLTVVESTYMVNSGCFKPKKVLIAAMYGLFMGFIFFLVINTLIYGRNDKHLFMFFNLDNNSVICSEKRKKMYKCTKPINKSGDPSMIKKKIAWGVCTSNGKTDKTKECYSLRGDINKMHVVENEKDCMSLRTIFMNQIKNLPPREQIIKNDIDNIKFKDGKCKTGTTVMKEAPYVHYSIEKNTG